MAPRAKRAKLQGIVTKELVKKIIKTAASVRSTRKKTDKEDEAINMICFVLFAKDYFKCDMLINGYGTFCPHYPENVIVPLHEHSPSRFIEDHLQFLKDSIRARRRSRFPVPVILYEGKYICRSAACHETAVSVWRSEVGLGVESWMYTETYSMTTGVAIYLLESLKFLRARQNDAKMLIHLGVDYICDLRMRNFSRRNNELINSSEDAYMQFYQRFKTVLFPYPTVDFFENFHLDMPIEDLIFDWTQKHVAITLQLPRDDDVEFPDVNYRRYKVWKVLKLTKNYLLFLLSCITSGEKGVLVHCLVGEDRTPLFICLLRLSLWADGLIHQSLSHVEITFLTLAYDWYLFGHNLPNRLEKRWQIMRFCFCCLEHISSNRFSKRQQSSGEEESTSSRSSAPSAASSDNTPDNTPDNTSDSTSASTSESSERERKLKQVQNLFLQFYDSRAEAKWSSEIDDEEEEEEEDDEENDDDIDSFTFREIVEEYLRSKRSNPLRVVVEYL